MIVVGVDAGGSRTELALGDEDAELVSRTVGSPGNVAVVGATAVTQLVSQLLGTAVSHLEQPRAVNYLVAGVAGAGDSERRAELEEQLRRDLPVEDLSVVTDAEIALYDAWGDEPGMILISGTGSIGLARTPAGVLERAGGFGWQTGDPGSGYWIGREAVKQTVRDLGSGSPSRLSREVCAALKAETAAEAREWLAGAAPAEVARLGALVDRLARAGEPNASRIAVGAAGELMKLLSPLAAHFEEPVSLALHGGVLTRGSAVRAQLTALLAERLPHLRVTASELDPCRGALKLARSRVRSR